MPILEGPEETFPSARQMRRALDRHSFTNGLTAWLMAATGPFIVLLNVGVAGGMSPESISSWVFGGFAFGGLLSVAFSTVYRIPLGIGWTIPGVVLLGGALEHLPFAECVGAFFATGILITVLGLTGWVGRLAALIPLNIVMAMVAGVFLPFVLNVITAFSGGWLVPTVTLVVFVGLMAVPWAASVLPPILGAIVAGTLALGATGQFTFEQPITIALTRPVFLAPVFSWQAMVELVIPLTITVVGIHNLQGFAICQANGYEPPRNTLTTVCGLGSFVFACVGTVPTCVTGPANGILNTSGEKERRYMGGVVFGLLMIGFGLMAPLATSVALALPVAFIGMVGGLAIFDVLRASFLNAFSGRLSIGALTTFLVTVADQSIFNIGAPFWAVVFGMLAAYLFERDQLGINNPRYGG